MLVATDERRPTNDVRTNDGRDNTAAVSVYHIFPRQGYRLLGMPISFHCGALCKTIKMFSVFDNIPFNQSLYGNKCIHVFPATDSLGSVGMRSAVLSVGGNSAYFSVLPGIPPKRVVDLLQSTQTGAG